MTKGVNTYEQKFKQLKIGLHNVSFFTPSSSKLDSPLVKKKIEKIKSLQSMPGKDREIFYAEYDLADYFLMHGKYDFALAFFSRLILLMDKLSWGFPQDFLNYFNIVSAVLSANIGHCYFLLGDLRSAYSPYLQCYSILRTYFPENIEEIKYILAKSSSCLFNHPHENNLDIKEIYQRKVDRCKEEESVKQQRFKKTLKERKCTVEYMKRIIKDEKNYSYEVFLNFYNESSYLSKDYKFLLDLLKAEVGFLENSIQSKNVLYASYRLHIDHIDKIFRNINPFNKQDRIIFKNCLYKVKLIYLSVIDPRIEQEIEDLYNRLLQSSYLYFIEMHSLNYLETNIHEFSEIKEYLKISDSSSTQELEWVFTLHPTIEIIKLTPEEEEKVTQIINKISKLKANLTPLESVRVKLKIYFLKLFLNSCDNLKDESVLIISRITNLQYQYNKNNNNFFNHNIIPLMSICLKLWTASHNLYYKNFHQSIVCYYEFLKFIENQNIKKAFENSKLNQFKALAGVNLDLALKANKITKEIPENIVFTQEFKTVGVIKPVLELKNKKNSAVEQSVIPVPKTSTISKADELPLSNQSLHDKVETKNDPVCLEESKMSQEVEKEPDIFILPKKEESWHDRIQKHVDDVTAAHDQVLKQAGIEINGPIGENPVMIYYKDSTAINNMILVYAGEYPSPMPSLIPTANPADISPSMEYNIIPVAEFSHFPINQLPVNSSLYSFILENQPSLIPDVNPIQLICNYQYVDYICLNNAEISQMILLLSTQIKVRRINELAFNAKLDATIIIEVIQFLDEQRIEVDKLNLNNTGLSNHEIAVLADLTPSRNINSITYLGLSGNRLVSDSGLKNSLRRILENCPLLIIICIDYEYVQDNIFDLRMQLTKNARNFSQIVQSLILNNKAEQLKNLFQDSVVLKCLDSFMEEFYDYAVKTNSLYCLNVLLNIPIAQNHTQAITATLESKIEMSTNKSSFLTPASNNRGSFRNRLVYTPTAQQPGQS